MSELEKKAKTLEQVEKEYLEFKYQKRGIISRREQMDKFNKIKWVRLEDAQKEIKIGGDLCERLMKILEHKDKERLELKRKLDAFHGFLVKLHNQSRDVKVNAFLGGIIKKFEELKEDENHEGKRMQIRT